MARDYMAEFKAKGGKVTHAAPGIAYGVDANADRSKREADRVNALIEQRYVSAHDHLGRAIITNGLGELIAVE